MPNTRRMTRRRAMQLAAVVTTHVGDAAQRRDGQAVTDWAAHEIEGFILN
jgi:hypothetical protein